MPLKSDGTFVEHPTNNYVKFPSNGDQTAKCHQCVPVGNDCWVVDTGNACIRKMKITENSVEWTHQGDQDVLKGHGPRQAVVSDDGM